MTAFAANITLRYTGPVVDGEDTVLELPTIEFESWDAVVAATTSAAKRYLDETHEVYILIAKAGDPWNLLRTARMQDGKVVLDQGWC